MINYINGVMPSAILAGGGGVAVWFGHALDLYVKIGGAAAITVGVIGGAFSIIKTHKEIKQIDKELEG